MFLRTIVLSGTTASYVRGTLAVRACWSVCVAITFFAGCATSSVNVLSVDSYSGSGHEAVAISDNGVTGHASEQRSQSIAVQKALQSCYALSDMKCRIVRIDDRLIGNDEVATTSATAPAPTITRNLLRSDTYSREQQQDSSSGARTFSGRRYACSELSKATAFSLLRQGHTYLDRDGDGNPCEWDKQPTRSYSSNCHWVSGYTRKNGTRVRGHRRCR